MRLLIGKHVCIFVHFIVSTVEDEWVTMAAHHSSVPLSSTFKVSSVTGRLQKERRVEMLLECAMVKEDGHVPKAEEKTRMANKRRGLHVTREAHCPGRGAYMRRTDNVIM
jgi:hypothetical protein